jgi:YgiT-type zinc finger domain-containing protein
MHKNKKTKKLSGLCDRCYKGILRPQKVSETICKRNRALIIEDVPAEVCSRCGYRYYDIKVVRAMDALFNEYAVHIDLPTVIFQQDVALKQAA